MKRTYTLLLLLATLAVNAQVANYSFTNTTGTYTPLASPTATGVSGDSDYGTIDLPFYFLYNSVVYDEVQVSTNGWLALGSFVGNSQTTNNLASTSAKRIVAPLWDDLNVISGNGSDISYQTIGTTPNRVFIVQWKDVNWNYSSSSGTPQNFQVHLYEANGVIEFHYGTMNTPNSPSASIGLNDEVGGSGHFLSVTPAATPTVSSTAADNSIAAATFLTNGLIYRFTPPSSGTDLVAAPLVQPTTGCYTSTETVEMVIFNGGAPLDFSVTNATVGVVITGPNAQTINTTLNTGTLSSYAPQTITLPGTYDMSAGGTHVFKPFVNIASDAILENDTFSVTSLTNLAVTALPQSVGFDGFTGSNLTTVFPDWKEAFGAASPSGTTSDWTSQTGVSATGNVTARVNLYTNNEEAWILGPKFSVSAGDSLYYKVSVTNWNSNSNPDVMGSDDMLRVMASTDCGGSWFALDTVDASDNLPPTLTQRVVSLDAYASQEMIIGFLATDGPTDDSEDYDIHIDDIFIGVLPTIDLAATALVSPTSPSCYSATETVEVTITNNTNALIDFSTEPTTVGAVVSGPNPQTVSITLNSGTLAGAASQNVVVTSSYDMSTAGTYDFKPFVNNVNDGDNSNDTAQVVTLINEAVITLPDEVDFTGFTGANLNTVFTNWSEGSGTNYPEGSASDWIEQTGVGGSGNVTARINLYTDSREEWIVGPKFNATSNDVLTYKVAVTNWNSTTVADVMGSDDKMRVMASTDCGASWVAIDSVDASNNLTTSLVQRTVPLGSLSGQDVIIAFLATDGPINDSEDYDLHLDDIFIHTVLDNDLGAIEVLEPIDNTCSDTAQEVHVIIKNFGLQSQTNIPVSVDVTGGATASISTTYTGTIDLNEVDTVLVGVVNTSAGGAITFKAYTQLGSEQDLTNDSVEVSLSLFALPVVDLGADTAICDGEALVLDAGTFSQYDWNTTASTQTISVNSAGIYSLTVTDANSCVGAGDIELSIDTLPVVSLSSDTAICLNDTIVLDAGTFNSYEWSTTEITQMITVENAGTYQVTVTDGNGCEGNDDFVLSLNALPTPDLGAPASFCAGESTVLYAGEYDVFQWNDLSTEDSLIVSSGGTYSVTVTDTNMCLAADTIQVSELPLPAPDLGDDSGYCIGSTLTLNPGAFDTYVWSDNSGQSTLDVSTAGTYSVTVTAANGCENSDEIVISEYPLPIVSLGADTTITDGSPYTLDAGAGFSVYEWQDASSGQTFTATATGTFTVTVTDANGCVNSDEVTVEIWPTAIDELGATHGLMVYPNPTTGLISIQLENNVSGVVDIEIINLNGELLMTKRYASQTGAFNSNIDISHFAKGVYFLKVRTDSSQSVTNIILH